LGAPLARRLLRMRHAGSMTILVKVATAASLTLSAGSFGPTDPVAVCAEQARTYGPDFEVAGSFATTVREVRDLTPGVDCPLA
jgi:hypothetical protein